MAPFLFYIAEIFLRLRLFQSDRVHALRRRSGGAAAITQKESDPLFFGTWSQVATASSHTQAKEHGVLCLEYDYDYAKPLCAALQPQFASGKSPGLNSRESLQSRRLWRLMRVFLLTDMVLFVFLIRSESFEMRTLTSVLLKTLSEFATTKTPAIVLDQSINARLSGMKLTHNLLESALLGASSSSQPLSVASPLTDATKQRT